MGSDGTRISIPVGRPGRRWRGAGVAAATVALVGSLAGLALAGGGFTVGSATNAKLHEQVLVNAQSRTLYELSPETARHLLCKSEECFGLWPPLTVNSSGARLTAGPGVRGHLGLVARGKGRWQVTLGGLPLYRYSGDASAGQTNGQDIHSFGGTWHVVGVSGASSQQSAGW
jgi:predicted lipoprotein with Yx(FWY)xxD motif